MMTATQHWSDQLPKIVCDDAVDWCQTYSTFEEAWQACERGNWMLWLIGYYSGEPGSDKRRRLVLAACECARLVLEYIPAEEDRSRFAIETAEKWARGEKGVSLDDVRSAAQASFAAYAAAVAAYAAYAAASAAHDAYHGATKETLKTCADIVRKHYPTFEIGVIAEAQDHPTEKEDGAH